MKESKVRKKFVPDNRMQALIDRRLQLVVGQKRHVLCDNAEFLVYHWSGKASTFAPATGEHADKESRIEIGDHSARVDNGMDFPFTQEIPSRKNNSFELSALNWAKDYAFFIDHSPAEVYANEALVGEFHWQLDEARHFQYPDEQKEAGFLARELGAGGISFAHTCPDLSIGLKLGWTGLLDKVRKYKKQYQEKGESERVEYLAGSELVIESIIRYIQRHVDKVKELAASEINNDQLNIYLSIAETCEAIATRAPQTLKEAVQWIWMFQVVERMHGHGNGYGRTDQLLIDFYKSDMEKGILTRQEARELVGEMYIKYGSYTALGGRLQDGSDATNEMSWVCLEAYDLVGGINHLGVMWHPEMDKEFYAYANDILTRHGCGVPTLVNYDVLKASEVRSGYKPEDAWNIAYSGCQWYCGVGTEYNDQDVNSLVLLKPMQRAIELGIEQKIDSFGALWNIYNEEVDKTANALVDFKNATYNWQAKVWPEMVTTFCMHDCIEKGRDCTDIDAVRYNYTSVNVLGVPNVSDSLYAIKKLVFEDKTYTLAQMQAAIESDWEGQEIMRQHFLNCSKFGNDEDASDDMAIQVSENVREILESKKNIKGFNFRPSLFQYMGHTYAGPMLGATPDGRKASEPIAHGMNPMHGRNHKGIAATVESFCKLDFSKYQGGSFQLELTPNFFKTGSDSGKLMDSFSQNFFNKGGVQINFNLVDFKVLEEAMNDNENPIYHDINVKVTGYSSHFVTMDKKFQKEFIERVNYQNL
ncbi:pyruvate formate lyase family protein [Labilibacter marinus]|uniref:pyruvate formate lyase family protein n=1 Tax=Labilibacter marinus TaxID=1477105 RepID=UPI00094FD797|nr:pyruvate formate lyase family protein [Labilibacter marinus]